MKNMIYCDANILLRYLLRDNEKHFLSAQNLVNNENVFILNEVVAEIVYVLNKVYSVDKKKVCSILTDLFNRDNIHLQSKKVIISALTIYSSNMMDFVDCILCSYGKIEGVSIASFDSKVNKYIKRK
jgi:predicted nucleic-acid-binding protein